MTFREYLNHKWNKAQFIIGKNTFDVDQPIPRGRDWRSTEIYLNEDFDIIKKTLLCYCNFSVDTHKSRPKAYENIKHKKCIKFEHMGKWKKYTETGKIKFFKNLSISKFIISPRGNGVDCFRNWDALYMKCIPIVPRSKYMEDYADLPILFTDDYKEITFRYLNETYQKMLNKNYNIRKLFLSYWKKRYSMETLKKYITLLPD